MRGRVPAGPADLTRSDHVCWAFDDRSDFVRAAGAFLAEGALAGERLMYLGDRSPAELLADVAALDGLRGSLRTGALTVLPLPEIYGSAGRLTDEDQLRVYAEATDEALAAGYTGLRVAADATALALDGAAGGQARWEHRADELLAEGALSAMCGYDRTVVPVETLADIAAAHPSVRGPADPADLAPFRLYFADATLVLAGVVDAFGADRLARLLRASHAPATASGSLVIDVSPLEFVDARGAYTLARWGVQLRERGVELMLVGASEMLVRIWRALRFDQAATLDMRRDLRRGTA
jgi:anti-anti-sigma factor